MLKNLKATITDLAYGAVNMAEDYLDTAPGQEKKQAAIAYIVSMLPIPGLFKGIIGFVLSKFIDEAVENAVTYMNNFKKKEGNL